MKVYCDASRHDHQKALRALWSATYPDQELHGLISDQWNEMGWQGRDPSTDFRGAGFISLENLLFFAKTFSGTLMMLSAYGFSSIVVLFRIPLISYLHEENENLS